MKENIIILGVVALIVILAGYYVYRAKKSGKKCIGCPDSKTCGMGKKDCCCGCINEQLHK
jgi:glucose uptake protein GlcU